MASPETLREGRALYEKNCVFCHGTDGKGPDWGVQFYPPVPSLVESEPELEEQQVFAIISRGIRYTAMPSFSKALKEEEIWKITMWVREGLSGGPQGAEGGLPAQEP
jgi:mono/diheme cytochrome c family protein